MPLYTPSVEIWINLIFLPVVFSLLIVSMTRFAVPMVFVSMAFAGFSLQSFIRARAAQWIIASISFFSKKDLIVSCFVISRIFFAGAKNGKLLFKPRIVFPSLPVLPVRSIFLYFIFARILPYSEYVMI